MAFHLLRTGLPRSIFALSVLLAVTGFAASAHGQTYTLKTLANLGSSITPSGLVADPEGNLYGSTMYPASGGNIIFKLDASRGYAQSTLTRFSDEQYTLSDVVLDKTGSVYVAATGSTCALYRLNAADNYARSRLSVLQGDYWPVRSLAIDEAGTIIGTSPLGGSSIANGFIFKFDASHGYTASMLLECWAPGGNHPNGWLVADTSDNFYGVCSMGGASGSGTIFKLNASNGYAFTKVVNLPGPGDSYGINAVIDAAGNLYCATATFTGHGGNIYKFDASRGYARSTLATFSTEDPGSLAIDAAGDLFGSAVDPGGSSSRVFKLDASKGYAQSTIATFSGAPVGMPLLVDASGNIFGTTDGSMGGNGTVFELSPVYSHGDANRDGVVDDNDLGILLGAWGTGTTWAQGDFNGDKKVDDNDLGELLSAWTGTTPAAPEPVSMALLAAGGLAMLRRRK